VHRGSIKILKELILFKEVVLEAKKQAEKGAENGVEQTKRK
jgi:hypothetical protein